MALSLNTQLRQTQRLTMTQSLRQQIEMLQLSTLELAETLNEELEANPVLELDELIESEKDGSKEELLSGDLSRELSHDDPDVDAYSRDLPDDSDYNDLSVDDDKKRQYLENAVVQSKSLFEHLMEQARMAVTGERFLSLIERIISSLDENGFFTADRDLFAAEAGVERRHVDEALVVIRSLDPLGCGVCDVRESLLIQTKARYPEETLLVAMIEHHFDLLSSLMYEKIAKALCVDIGEIKEKSRLLQGLSPYPGRAFAHNETRYIVPDIEVRLVDGEIFITFNDEWIPKVRISPRYEKMLLKKDIDKNLKEYIKERIGAAKQLMKNISGRRETIEKVVKAIMFHQISFLEKGPGHLKPLTYSQVAEVASCHESTVSRVSSNKFMRCSWGTFELKYFFVSKIRSGDEDHSSDEILTLIRDIVAKENQESPYSDDEISEFLSRSGVSVARRTVAKYRDILDIPSSNKRKRLNLLKSEGGTL